MRRFAGALAAFALVAVVVVAYLALSGGGKSAQNNSYWVELDNAFGLVQGGDMKVAGVRAGTISQLKLDKKSLHALVQFKLKQSGFGSLRSDTTCSTRPQSLIGEYFLDCDPGVSRQVLKGGSVIPVTSTSSTVAPDLVNDVLRQPYKERLALIINELGAAVAGNPLALNAAIKRASPALQETDKVLAILANQNQVLANLARDGDQVISALAGNRKDISRFIDTANATAVASASRKVQLAQGFARLPGFLAQLRPAMKQLGITADKTAPALRNLDASASQLTTFLNRLGPFATASTPAIQALGNASLTGSQAVAAATPVVAQLNQFAQGTPELGKNLSIILQHLDNRAFAAEADPRSPGGQGYTGLEALLNYVFYQATSTTLFDANNHLLSVSLFASPDCSAYPSVAAVKAAANDPSNPLYKCISWAGPTQPGITTPDPTNPAGGSLQVGATVRTALSHGNTQPNAAPLVGSPGGPGATTPAGPAPGTAGSQPPAPASGLSSSVGAVQKSGSSAVNQVASAITGLLKPAAATGQGTPAQRSAVGSSQLDKSQKPLLDYLLGP